jgi:hypothetical protein
MAVLRQVLDTPAEGPFARIIARQRDKALKAALPVMKAMLGESVETRREALARQKEMERREAMERLEAGRIAGRPMASSLFSPSSMASMDSIAMTTPVGRGARNGQTPSPVSEIASTAAPTQAYPSRPTLPASHRGQERVVVRKSLPARVYGSR